MTGCNIQEVVGVPGMPRQEVEQCIQSLRNIVGEADEGKTNDRSTSVKNKFEKQHMLMQRMSECANPARVRSDLSQVIDEPEALTDAVYRATIAPVSSVVFGGHMPLLGSKLV